MQENQFFDPKLLSKYNTSGPRYTSYPTALEFHDEFSEQDFIKVDQKARLLIRNICMSFDAYMKQHVNQQRFSRVI